jgi:hypothetical protein
VKDFEERLSRVRHQPVANSVPDTQPTIPFLRDDGVSFEPLVDPLGFQADGASSADADVMHSSAQTSSISSRHTPAYSALFNQSFVQPLERFQVWNGVDSVASANPFALR